MVCIASVIPPKAHLQRAFLFIAPLLSLLISMSSPPSALDVMDLGPRRLSLDSLLPSGLPSSITVRDVQMSGGTFHSVAGNSNNTHNHHYHGCTVFMSDQGQRLLPSKVASPITRRGSTSVIRTKSSAVRNSRMRPYPPRRPHSASNVIYPGSGAAADPSTQLLRAKTILLMIHKLVDPHADHTGIFHRIKPGLVELEVLVDFACAGYRACSPWTKFGRNIRASIDRRMEECNLILTELLGEIIRLPYRSFPRIRRAYLVVHQWWTGNEPEEIVSIRTRVFKEAKAIGEWLRCLEV